MVEKEERKLTTVSFNKADLILFDKIKDKLPAKYKASKSPFSDFVHDCFYQGIDQASYREESLGDKPGRTCSPSNAP